ncbi:glutamate synthase, alpha subunit [Candidatus Aquiluna sp. IMCC13023]|uniref:glutamate synthase large subunit n=1 Tax=Candidatus Aquiluna sp. IMCC13023 TaxID=1081644 RepID=UPI00025B1BB3|nr:glutamate synthase large subunit [Candidatus Aquiluna sp. IMCC13023]EIC91325.1 glutamate synthase, alpha subunit [Candidatus Aquiluna sp. IMCC13023]
MVNNGPFHKFATTPKNQGLYDAAQERDACGLAMVATLRGYAGHDVVDMALSSLRNLEHRGAVGSDAGTGDGAGILTQMPDGFFRAVVDFDLPASGTYGVGLVFMDAKTASKDKARFQAICDEESLTVLGWRTPPTDSSVLGDLAKKAMPLIEQVFVSSSDLIAGMDLERRLFRARNRSEREIGLYLCSLSSKTIVYKGMVTTLQLEPFYPDLSDERYESLLALVHSRFSTNTFPSWPLAHPFRYIAHNGEINTVKGNANWMAARESQLSSELLGDIDQLKPIVSKGASDSATYDEVLELLVLSGRSLPHAMMMMIPGAWEKQLDLDPQLRDFYEYHSMIMEPWDGPAAVVFTDGDLVGATLDRNGLRPGRFVVTEDGFIILASEIGVADISPDKIVRKGRLQPGKMFLIDTVAGQIVEDEQIKSEVASLEPWGEWLEASRINLRDLPDREHVRYSSKSVKRRQRAFGYTEEDLKIFIAPMARIGQEPIGAMGTDTPIAAISERPKLLFDYFTQQFAQVTNPPLDAIREEVVTSMTTSIGPVRNLLEANAEHAKQMVLDYPIIGNDELAKIKHIDRANNIGKAVTISCLYRVDDGPEALEARLEAICAEVDQALLAGATFIVLSDRDSNRELAPIPSLLSCSAVHHHLIRNGTRMMAGLVIEAGDARDVHHVATLIGFGASAINPYLALETAEDLVFNGTITGITMERSSKNMIKALGKGVLKVMSKMGISTVSSYGGAQCFEAIGLSQELVDKYFTGTITKLGGVALPILHSEIAQRHAAAYPMESANQDSTPLDVGGEMKWRRDGPPHLFNPETIFKLQHSTSQKNYEIFKSYTNAVDDQAERLMTIRGLFSLNKELRTPVPISEVEPVHSIVKRFATGAMSMGSISPEAHETLAIAMNRLGGKSNTGEGGESVERLLDRERRSAVKQVASGRFGVTSMYLTHADDIQIKMAQGAKPGEGGQLPPNKVYPWIAELRHSTPGVGLISPPPHHDIYSIEDLKQLIFDLKRANRAARVHVKLVSQFGVGTVAAGVAKAKADVVLISGHDGGTGASPLNSLKHAGTPWELGLAETQQTLLLNGLRDRVVVQVDGSMKTGRDVIIAALLGAEEFGFATAPLVVEGCILMRVCHLDTCPVGVATQNPDLRKRFHGQADHVVNFFEFLAQEVREYLAELGFRTLQQAIGQVEVLDVNRAIRHWKADGLDLSPIFAAKDIVTTQTQYCSSSQDHELEKHFDFPLIETAKLALKDGKAVEIKSQINNTMQAIGTMLGNELTKKWGEQGLEPGTLKLTLTGSAGQSLGAFMPRGLQIDVEGDCNDYVGKGLSGGIISVRPPETAGFLASENVIAGNVIGYGATSGKIFLNGVVGERFMVRNSGAVAVAEGVGDHALEYMTGGRVVILGKTGINLGAGMSGGIAYVHRLSESKVNREALQLGEITLSVLDQTGEDELQAILEQHLDLTRSPLAKIILDDFSTYAKEFVKVMPRDYARIVEIQQDARATGIDLDGEEVWTQILEVTNG